MYKIIKDQCCKYLFQIMSIMRPSIFLPLCWTLLPSYVCEPKREGNILALVMPYPTRWMVLKTLSRELKEFGYQTTVVLPADEVIENSMTNSGVDIIVSNGLTQFYSSFDKMVSLLFSNGFSGNAKFATSVQIIDKLCPYLVHDSVLMDTLHKRKFDAAIIDTPLVNLCTSVIPYKLSIPFIQYGRNFKLHEMRTLVHPGVYPATLLLTVSDKMSYLQRVQNILLYIKSMVFADPLHPPNIVGTFAPEKQHLTNQQLQAKTSLYLLETDELLDYHLPAMPDMKLIGGTETRPAAPLSGQLKLYMDSAVEGAIIVSFGSLITDIPEVVLNKFSEVFKLDPNLKFVFRSGNETKISLNVMYMPWIPQNDLLGHKNTKVFITHCGDKGQFEALYHGVPMIGMPVVGDQIYNAVRMVRKGFGIQLNVVDFTPDMLHCAIQEILNNSSYKDNIQKASEIFRNRPMSPSKRAAWWIDHVIKYGGDHLHSEATHMPLYQFLLIDVFLGICVLLLLVLFVCFMCLTALRNIIHCRKQKRD